ncbi:MAG: hypothetical protein KGN37_17405, partial [Burkholderiales bacterium]|nr:hypothetical protein [Burkholderiales bacterium]
MNLTLLVQRCPSMQMSPIQIVKTLGALIDGCYTGAWWWWLRLWWAGRELTDALVVFGEDSKEAKEAREKWDDMDFAVQFGRPAPSPVRNLIKIAHRQGVRADDLWLMLLNGKIELTDQGKVSVKRCSWHSYLLGMPVGLICLGTLWVCLSSISTWPLTLGQKTVCFMLTIIWYWPAWRGWTLHYWRAPRALLRSGEKVESLAKMQEPAQLLAFPST